MSTGAKRRACALALALLWTLVAATPAAGQDPGQAVQGSLRHEGEPVSGAGVTVADADGAEVGRAVTGDDGDWRVDLPAPGTYRVTLDEASLPADVSLRDPERATLEVPVRGGQERTLIFALGEPGETPGRRLLPRMLQATVNGVKFGLIIAMTAVGLSLIYGTTRLINFAHGDMVTFGAVVAFFLNAAGPRLHLVYAGAVAVACGGLLGAVLERGLWQPLRARGTGLFQMLVISIGLMLLLRHLHLLAFGGTSRSYAHYALQQAWTLGPVRVTPRDLTVMGLSALLLLAVALLLQRTRIGRAMRAVSDNRDLAESSGIDVQRVILVVWVLGGALAAIGGVFLGAVENVNYLMGFRLLLLMFAGVILGGLGTAYGALAGSLAVGLVTEWSVLYFPADLKFLWALAVLVAVLLVRPQGLLGFGERLG